MLSLRMDLCSAVSWGCDGSSFNLDNDQLGSNKKRGCYFLYLLRSMGKGPDIVEVVSGILDLRWTFLSINLRANFNGVGRRRWKQITAVDQMERSNVRNQFTR